MQPQNYKTTYKNNLSSTNILFCGQIFLQKPKNMKIRKKKESRWKEERKREEEKEKEIPQSYPFEGFVQRVRFL